MSIKLMTAVWEMDFPDATRKLVMLALADFANDDGECFPMIRTIGKKAGIGQRQTRYIVSEFVDKGLLRRELCRRQNGSKTASRYTLMLATPHRQPSAYAPPAAQCLSHRQPSAHLEPSLEPRIPQPPLLRSKRGSRITRAERKELEAVAKREMNAARLWYAGVPSDRREEVCLALGVGPPPDGRNYYHPTAEYELSAYRAHLKTQVRKESA